MINICLFSCIELRLVNPTEPVLHKKRKGYSKRGVLHTHKEGISIQKLKHRLFHITNEIEFPVKTFSKGSQKSKNSKYSSLRQGSNASVLSK
jgi:hypothetical protein